MSNLKCYIPKKGIDDVIALKLGFPVEGGNLRVATLRGLYDDAHPDAELDLTDLDKAAKDLKNYRNQLSKENRKRINSLFSRDNKGTLRESWAETLDRLEQAFSPEERFNRVNMIATMFSDRLDALTEANPNKSRQEICNGFKVNGQLLGGQFGIWEGVYNTLLENYSEAIEAEDTEEAEKWDVVINNFPSLVAFAKIRLRDSEEIILGNTIEYAADANPDNFGDNDISQIIDIETSTREGYQEIKEYTTAFGSIGKQVRRILSLTEQVDENGETMYDDLGYPIMLDPVKSHQSLMELLRGVRTATDMMNKLREASKGQPWLSTIVEQLDNDNLARTQFFVDFKKNFQPYSILVQKMVNGIMEFRTKILNRVNNVLIGKYSTRISMKKPINPDNSVFNKEGNVVWSNLANTRKLIEEYLFEPHEGEKTAIFKELRRLGISYSISSVDALMASASDLDALVNQFKEATEENKDTIKALLDNAQAPTDGSIFNQTQHYGKGAKVAQPAKFYTSLRNGGIGYNEQRRVLGEILESLGIEINPATLDKILHNRASLKAITNNLKELVQYGIDSVLFKTELKDLINGNYVDLGTRKFKDMLAYKPENYKGSKDRRNVGPIREKIDKILDEVVKQQEGLRVESRARYKDKNGNNVTLFSNIAPSYMGDKLDRIAKYVEEGNRDGIRQIIENEFMGSSMFYDKRTGKFLNKWIEELYNSTTNEESFAANFKYKRFLGTSDINFENFTSKQHAIDMFTEYLSERQINSKSQYGWYPVFILGDSGVSKYIKARRYERAGILEGMYNMYKSEVERMKLTAAANKKLSDDGYTLIDNVSKKVDIREDGTVYIGKSNPFTLLPFLNKVFQDRDIADIKEAEVKDAINAYMKQACQKFKDQMDTLGLLETKEVRGNNGKVVNVRYVYFDQEMTDGSNRTIDEVLEDFYWNTKFATMNQLQMFTVDPAFYAGTKDLQKRYKEIHAPGSILDLEARDFDDNLYSENGIETALYFEDINVNAELSNPEFMKAIEAKFGKESNVYKAYLKNTLTDGQGYRTLKSYRKVKGMAGQWTREMENAYLEIQKIRTENGSKNLTNEQITRLAQLAVVFQPIKPYLYTIENYAINNENKLMIPVQHKYAEAVLIPELLPEGSKLRDMAYYMEDKDIDMIGSTKIVKVGGFGAANISNTTDATSLKNALDKGYVHRLSYGDYRIQTNVPEHVNSSQLFGTQVRKLIMANLNLNGDYSSYFQGKMFKFTEKSNNGKPVRMTGRNLLALYNSLIVANILDSYNAFDAEASDIQKLSEKLTQSTLSNSRESIDNLFAYALTADDQFALPLFEGGLEHDSAALLFSMFKKLVNKQKIKGGSAVQVSAFGINGYNEDESLKYITDPSNPDNIIYAECERPWAFSYTLNGQEIEIDFNTYCNPDGTLKLGKKLSEDAPEYKLCQSFKDDEGNVRMPLIEERFPNILSTVAYRIPTERDYSMINLRTVRFSQKTAGGTLKVPAQGTTIAGFDFDIDKLYFMIYEFEANTDFSKEKIAEIWKAAYEEQMKEAHRSGDISYLEKLKAAKENDQIGQELVNSVFSIFNSRTAGDIVSANEDASSKKLYEYWKDAGLEGTPEQFFTDYVTRHSEELVKFDSYDNTKSILDNSRAQRNNMLIDIIRARLMDYETFEQRYTPGGFANSSKSARVLRELLYGDVSDTMTGQQILDTAQARIADNAEDPEPNYDPSDPMTIIVYNQQNQVAGKLIGIFANQNTNHAFASLMKSFTVKPEYAIQFAGHIAESDLLHKDDPVKLAEIDLNVAELLAASVDAVKDPVLNFLNLNTVTADSGAVLARLGYSTTEIGLLFNQPIIKEICERIFNNNERFDIAVTNVRNAYAQNIEEDVNYNPESCTTDKLAKTIVDYRHQGKSLMSSNSFRESQLQVLKLFTNIKTVSDDVSAFVTASKFTASNAVGSTFGDMYAQEFKVERYLGRFVKNQMGKNKLSVDMEVTDTIDHPISTWEQIGMSDEDYISALMNNPFAYEQAMYDMNRRTSNTLSRYFPYDRPVYRQIRSTLNRLTCRGLIDAETINAAHNEALVYMLSQQEHSLFNGELPRFQDREVSQRDYYNKEFAKDLYVKLEASPELAALPLFQYMDFNAEEVVDRFGRETGEELITIKITDVGGLAPYQKEALKESWKQLIDIDPELAQELFLYNYYKLGFTFSPLAFMNLAPTALKQMMVVGVDETGNQISYIDFLNNVLSGRFGGVIGNANDFCRQFILNHLDNYRFNYKIAKSSKEHPSVEYDYIRKKVNLNGVAQSEFTIDLNDKELGENAKSFIVTDDHIEKHDTAFVPCITIDGIAYIAKGDGSQFNVSSSASMTYVKAVPQGTKNISLAYYSSGATVTEAIQPDISVDQQSTTNPEEIESTPTPTILTVEEAASDLIIEMVEAMRAEAQTAKRVFDELAAEAQVTALLQQMTINNNQDLVNVINQQREKIGLKGCFALNSEGEITKMC